MDWSHLFFGFDGRINRKPYWIASLILAAIEFTGFIVAQNLEQDRLIGVIGMAVLYPDFAVAMKRAHDRETPYWILFSYLILSVLQNALSVFALDGPADSPTALYWIVFIPLVIVGLYLFIELGFYRGVSGPNRFGPDPLERRT